MQLRGADVDTIIGRALVFGDVNRNRKKILGVYQLVDFLIWLQLTNC